MATPAEKIAASVEVLQRLQQGGRRVLKSAELSRVHRERLLRHGVLQPVIKGWLMPSGTVAGSTALWEFCAAYCTDRFGTDWHLSPEHSLQLFTDPAAAPGRLVVHTPQGTNNTLDLPFGTSIYDLKCAALPAPGELMEHAGLRLLTPAAALVRVAESFFVRHPEAARAALAGIDTASHVVRLLLEGGHSAVAGRLAGAFRSVGRGDVADEIVGTMKAAGYDVRAHDPFDAEPAATQPPAPVAPIVARMHELWQAMRDTVAETFPDPPAPRPDRDAYLQSLDDLFARDAFHSLAIEGHRIAPEVIHRAQANGPAGVAEEQSAGDVVEARAYWNAFQLLKETVAKVVAGENAGALTRTAYLAWQQALGQPTAEVPAAAAAGDAASRHLSLRWKAEREAVPALFDLLEQEPAASVRAVLGHWMFGYIHQYPDGDGRLARFVLNVMLASGGYPWLVIRVEDRATYMDALERASVDADIQPLARFIGDRVRWSLEQQRTATRTGSQSPEQAGPDWQSPSV